VTAVSGPEAGDSRRARRDDCIIWGLIDVQVNGR
jgi:hypothetical protein